MAGVLARSARVPLLSAARTQRASRWLRPAAGVRSFSQPTEADRLAVIEVRSFSQPTEADRLAVIEAIATVDPLELAKEPKLDGLLVDLRKVLEEKGATITTDGTPPTPGTKDLALWAILNGTPFIAFGFFDNALMLLVGDLIDTQLSMSIGVSTMCACAIGNIVGDVFGIFASNPMESAVVGAAKVLRLPMPHLSAPQKLTSTARLWKSMGCVGGVVIGCGLGMFPLVFPDRFRLWESNNTLWKK